MEITVSVTHAELVEMKLDTIGLEELVVDTLEEQKDDLCTFTAKVEIQTDHGKYPLTPNLMVDELIPGRADIWLSPEFATTGFHLRDSFKGLKCSPEARTEWGRILREIADDVENAK